jgi:hypothetical protein
MWVVVITALGAQIRHFAAKSDATTLLFARDLLTNTILALFGRWSDVHHPCKWQCMRMCMRLCNCEAMEALRGIWAKIVIDNSRVC